MTVEVSSPIQRVARIDDAKRVKLFIKRDDLLPMPGGGNKIRKLTRILGDVHEANVSALITNGGVQSNHARVVALEAARRGWSCSLVLHGEERALENPTGNLLLMLLAGARVRIVEADQISLTIEEEAERYHLAGQEALIVPGGGHSLAGALAYVDAVAELANQWSGLAPDFIVHASGTGATQAGITAGCVLQGWSTNVIGISVARRNPRGEEAVREICDQIQNHLGCPPLTARIDFRDEWIGRGYEQTNDRVLATIDRVARQTGIILDPTYTGKAFLGLLDLIRRGEIHPGSRVVFWHTGGLLNLLASDIYTHERSSHLRRQT